MAATNQQRLDALERQAADLAARLDRAGEDKLALAGRVHFAEANNSVLAKIVADLARTVGDRQAEATAWTILDMTTAVMPAARHSPGARHLRLIGSDEPPPGKPGASMRRGSR